MMYGVSSQLPYTPEQQTYTQEQLAEYAKITGGYKPPMQWSQWGSGPHPSPPIYTDIAKTKEIEELKKRVAWLEGVIDKLLTNG